ncbi:MAG: CcmD family protein [Cytophagaceae bacterium]|nr:CcmD family protein [Gemmatimonadaceae bacterium]
MPDNRPYIVAAFVFTWVAILSYGFFLRRTRAAAEERLTRTQRTLGGGA